MIIKNRRVLDSWVDRVPVLNIITSVKEIEHNGPGHICIFYHITPHERVHFQTNIRTMHRTRITYLIKVRTDFDVVNKQHVEYFTFQRWKISFIILIYSRDHECFATIRSTVGTIHPTTVVYMYIIQ